MTKCVVLGVAAVAAGLSVSVSFATDGTWIYKQWDAKTTWKASERWYQESRPGDGGVATMPKDINTLAQNVDGLTLSGLIFTDLVRSYSVTGMPIKLTGDAFIQQTSASSTPVLDVGFEAAESTATVTKTGAGAVNLKANAFTGFSSMTLNGGTIQSSVASGAVVSDSKIVLKNGFVEWMPAGSEAAEGEMTSLEVASGASAVSVRKGNAPSATLTLGSLALAEHTSFFVRTSAADTLGVSEKVLVSGEGKPVAADGLIDARFTAQNTAAAGYPLAPLSATDADGLTYATGTALVSGVDVVGLAIVTEATVISANTKVGALQVKGGGLTLAEGVTLTVGDNGKPAGVWLSQSAGESPIQGTGTLAFGSSEGFIYGDTPTSPAKLVVGTPISGTAGVNLIARNVSTANGKRPTLSFADGYVAGWTGPTRFYGYSVALKKDIFPANHELQFLGGMDEKQSSAMYTIARGSSDGHFRVSGSGDGNGVLQNNGGSWQGQAWTLSAAGSFTLEDDAMIGPAASSSAVFKCPVDGKGDLTVGGNVTQFNATNTYAGATKVTGSAVLLVANGGTLGQGPMEIGSSATVYFTDNAGARAVTNEISTRTGTLVVQNETTSFAKDIGASSIQLQAGAKVEASGAVCAGNASLDYGSELKGVGDRAVLTVGRDAAETNVVAATLSGTLSVVKTGTNTVELFGPMAYTGSTRIESGTLRLARRDGTPDPADVSYWLDADDPDSLVWNESKASYTTWKSKPGYGIDFSIPSGQIAGANPIGGVTSPRTLNAGRHALYFERVKTARLYGSKSVRQRELMMVVEGGDHAGETAGGGGPFGRADADFGLRGGTSIPVGAKTDGANYMTWGYGYGNGVKTSSNVSIAKGSPTVLTVGHGRDLICGYGAYNSRSVFQPGLAGYATDSGNNYGRNWDGDIGEVIGFKRTLSDGERQRIENYLGEKWLGRTLTAADKLAPIPETSLSAETTLEILAAGVFDVNGHDVTVASLSGCGAIVNSSTNLATIRVTGTSAFAGKVAGKVVLVVNNAAGAVNAAFRDGATFVVDGGSATIDTYTAGFPSNGIAFRVDATVRDSMTLNEGGLVTNWATTAGTVARFYNKSKISFWSRDAIPPTYESVAINGHPAAHFTCADTKTYPGRSSMIASASCTAKTLAVVIKLGSINGYLLGCNGSSELGLIYDGSYSMRVQGVSVLRAGETIFVNGEDRSSTAYMTGFSVPGDFQVIVSTSSDWSPVASRRTSTYYLGGYGNPGADFYMGEAIAWNRVLSKEECRTVSEYLMAKWSTSAAYSDAVLDSSSGIGVSGSGTLDMGGRDLTLARLAGGNGGTLSNVGTLTVTDEFVFNAVNGRVDALTVDGDLAIGSQAVARFLNGDTLDRAFPMQKALEVTGSVSGDLTVTEGLPRKWTWSRAGNVWSVVKNGLMLLLR